MRVSVPNTHKEDKDWDNVAYPGPLSLARVGVRAADNKMQQEIRQWPAGVFYSHQTNPRREAIDSE